MIVAAARRDSGLLTTRVRFGAFFLIWGLTAALTVHPAGWARAFILGFDAGALTYIGLTAVLMGGATPDRMRRIAGSADASRFVLLIVAGLVISAVMATLTYELIQRDAHDPLDVALTIATLPIAWLFSNLVYAVHYAHLFYSRDDGGADRAGLDFPGKDEPGYLDFCYFAMTLGMTFQTSDIQITRRAIRRVALGHSLLAFAFNIGIVAISVNVLSNS